MELNQVKNQKVLADWLKANEAFGLMLPDGWFGRPGDNFQEVTLITDRKFKLIIEIDEQLHLIIAKTKTFEILLEGNDLIFKNFLNVTFDRLGYGDFIPHVKSYLTGELRFVSYKV